MCGDISLIDFLLTDTPDETSRHKTSNDGELEHGEGEESIEQVDVEECLSESEGGSSEEEEDETLDIEPTGEALRRNQRRSRSRVNPSKLNIVL